jgi:drug/metabolite transporter (DMT)-like permease
MKKLLKMISKKNGSDLKRELTFAHLIIVMLSIVSIILLALGATLTINFDPKLSTIAGVLLGVLALVSASMSYVYSKTK